MLVPVWVETDHQTEAQRAHGGSQYQVARTVAEAVAKDHPQVDDIQRRGGQAKEVQAIGRLADVAKDPDHTAYPAGRRPCRDPHQQAESHEQEGHCRAQCQPVQIRRLDEQSERQIKDHSRQDAYPQQALLEFRIEGLAASRYETDDRLDTGHDILVHPTRGSQSPREDARDDRIRSRLSSSASTQSGSKCCPDSPRISSRVCSSVHARL